MADSSHGSQDDEQRLSRIGTKWSMLAEAHQNDDQSCSSAQAAILDRYRGAVYRYLLGAIRDPEVAEELSHEFALRFLRGDFRRASPNKGRFRDYIKRVLINLVNDHYRATGKTARQFGVNEQIVDHQPHDDSESFESHLQREILASSWDALEATQPSYYSILRMRVDDPEKSSREIAERINSEQNKHLSADSVRKTLERARAKFAVLLLDQVEQFCAVATIDDLESELRALNLMQYCRMSFEQRRDSSSG